MRVCSPWDKFSLEFPKAGDFFTNQFGPRKIYLVWTSFWAAYHVIWISLDWYWWNIKVPYKGPWVIFLTNQCYLLMTILAFLDFITGFYIHCTRRDILTADNRISLPWYMKVVWVLFNISNSGSILITIGYWTMLRKSTGASTLNKHGINCIYTVGSLLLTRKPVRFQHAYIPVMYNFAFIIFTVIFNLSGGRTIYSFLNWRVNPGKAAMLSVLYILILVPLVHFSVYGLYRLRIALYNRYCDRDTDKNQNDKHTDAEMKMLRAKEKQMEAERRAGSVSSNKPSLSDVNNSEVPILEV